MCVGGGGWDKQGLLGKVKGRILNQYGQEFIRESIAEDNVTFDTPHVIHVFIRAAINFFAMS